MDQELQNQLFEKYPEIFSNRLKSPTESCMSMGIECGNGWYNLINSICQIVESLNKNIKERNRLIAGNNEEIIDFKREVLFGTGSALFFKKDIFLEVGGFDDRFFMFYEDLDEITHGGIVK